MNIPKQYQQGYIEFYKLRFKVTPDVLIPRPETELLVDEVINFVHKNNSHPYTILDLGTGSGCIAISLAKHLPTFHVGTQNVGTQIIATDISKKALKIAEENYQSLCCHPKSGASKVQFIQSDLLNFFYSNSSNYTLDAKPSTLSTIIVTNLPYIPTSRIPHLHPSVKDFEPHLALDGGKDGFDLYRKLFQQIQSFSLPPQGWHLKLIVCEIDDTQDKIALKEAQKYFPKAKVEVKKDLSKRPRILVVYF